MPQVSEKYLEERKNNIAKSAIDIFAKKGYSYTSMKDIMNGANVSRGGLYAHFENIDAVFVAALKYDDAVQAKRLLEPNLEKSFLPQLQDWVYETVLSVTETDSHLVRAKSEFFLSHSITQVPYLSQRHQRLSLNIQQFLQLGIEKGEFKKEIDLSSFSELLISMIDGVMLHKCYQYSSNTNIFNVLKQMNQMLEGSLMKE